MKLRLGIVTPVVHLNPRFDPPGWEVAGTIDDIVAVSVAAERHGFAWATCSEHVAVPTALSSQRGGRYWDPLVTLAMVAAATDRLGLCAHVVVVGYHHPLEIVKHYGTLDVASHGRVILGLGVGSLEPEFELLGHAFAGRGERADDAIGAIRAAWGDDVPSYEGTHYTFSGFRVEPSGVPGRPLEIWVGGRTRRSLRRAIALADGWVPFRLTEPELAAVLSEPAAAEALAARRRPLELIFAPEPPLDPAGAPTATAETVARYAALGATGLNLRFVAWSRSHYVEQLEAMQTVVAGA